MKGKAATKSKKASPGQPPFSRPKRIASAISKVVTVASKRRGSVQSANQRRQQQRRDAKN